MTQFYCINTFCPIHMNNFLCRKIFSNQSHLAQTLTLLTFIQQVSGSTLSRNTDSSVPTGKRWAAVSNEGNTASFHIPNNSLRLHLQGTS
jgi:hypothetical protein